MKTIPIDEARAIYEGELSRIRDRGKETLPIEAEARLAARTAIHARMHLANEPDRVMPGTATLARGSEDVTFSDEPGVHVGSWLRFSTHADSYQVAEIAGKSVKLTERFRGPSVAATATHVNGNMPRRHGAQTDWFAELWEMTDALIAEMFGEPPPAKPGPTVVASISGQGSWAGGKAVA